MSMLSRIVRLVILRLVRLFYPHIEARGEERLPNGPTLVVVGQPFGLADFHSRYLSDDHMAVDALTEEIDNRLDTVVLQAENAVLLTGIPLVAAWTAPRELESL